MALRAPAVDRRWNNAGSAGPPRSGPLAFKQKKLAEADERLEREVRKMEDRLAHAQAARQANAAKPAAQAAQGATPRWRGSQPSKVTGLNPTVVKSLSRLLPPARYPGTAEAAAAPAPVAAATGSQPRPAGAPYNREFASKHPLEVVTPAEQQREAKRDAERLAAKEAKAASEREWAEGQLDALKERARQRQIIKETGHARAWAEQRGRGSRTRSAGSELASKVEACAQWQVPRRAAPPPVSREASEIAWMKKVVASEPLEQVATATAELSSTPRVRSPPEPEEVLQPEVPQIVRRTVRTVAAAPPAVMPVPEPEPEPEPKRVTPRERNNAWSKLDEHAQDDDKDVPAVRFNAGRWSNPPVYGADGAQQEAEVVRTPREQARPVQHPQEQEGEEQAVRAEQARRRELQRERQEREREEILAEVRAIAAAAVEVQEEERATAAAAERRRAEEEAEAERTQQAELEAWRQEHVQLQRKAEEAQAAADVQANEAFAEAEAAQRRDEIAAQEAEAEAQRMRERLASMEARERADAEAREIRECEWQRQYQEERDAQLHREQRQKEEGERAARAQEHDQWEAEREAERDEARRQADEREHMHTRMNERALQAEARAAERRFVTAVCRLQALVRGRRGRRQATAVRQERGQRQQLQARQRAQEAAVVAAAVRLQACVRGREGRRRVATIRERRREEVAIAKAMRGSERQRRENLREVLGAAIPHMPSRDAAVAAADLCATQVPLPAGFAGSSDSNEGHQQQDASGQLKLVLQVESGGTASVNRRRPSHTPRGSGAATRGSKAPKGKAPAGGAGSFSVFIPASGASTTPELLTFAAAAASRVTQGGEVAGGWAYATSRGQVVDIDDFTEIHELRLRAAYLFATVKQAKPQPPPQGYE